MGILSKYNTIYEDTILKAIENTDARNLDELLNNESLFNIDPEEFRKNIEGNIYKKQYARYLLLKLEYLMSDNTVHLSGYNYITVEHILPQNPSDNSQWKKDFTDEQREYCTNKLANLVLISQKKNSALSNLDFEEKKKVYLKKRIDNHYITGIDREARILNKNLEDYIKIITQHIQYSELSNPLKTQVLANLDTILYKGPSVLRIRIPKQGGISFVGKQAFSRINSSTIKVEGPELLALNSLFIRKN